MRMNVMPKRQELAYKPIEQLQKSFQNLLKEKLLVGMALKYNLNEELKCNQLQKI